MTQKPEERREWLASLKVGDWVGVVPENYPKSKDLGITGFKTPVTKITPEAFYVNYTSRFCFDAQGNGRFFIMVPLTPEIEVAHVHTVAVLEEARKDPWDI